jgi:branched-chain amino acid transport system substrate-binding protein
MVPEYTDTFRTRRWKVKKTCNGLMVILFCWFISMSAGTGYVHAQKEINFGIICALSTPAAVWGIPNARSMELSADKINDRGGFKVDGETYKWKIIMYDHKYVPAEAVKALNKAIFSDNIAFAAIQGGSPTLACIPLLKQNKILSLNNAAGGKAVTNPDNPLVFRHKPAVEAHYAASFPYFLRNVGIKTIGSINPDDETGRANLEATRYIAEIVKIDVVAGEFYERGVKDFVPVLTRIIAKNPDMIETGMSDPTSQALILKQARELGYKGKVFLVWGPDPVQVKKIAGDFAEGSYLGVAPAEPLTENAKKLYERFLKKYPASEWHAGYYYHSELFDCLTQGINKCQSFDPMVIADTLEDLTWEGPLGTRSWGGTKLFDIKRQMLMPVYLQTFRGGEAVPWIAVDVPPGILD